SFFFSSRRRHTRSKRDWSSDVCSSDLTSGSAQEDDELREDAHTAGCELISAHPLRGVVTVHGTLRAVTLQPRTGSCTLEAELYDGSGSVRLVWLGRRGIDGIERGRRLTVRGRLSVREGVD